MNRIECTGWRVITITLVAVSANETRGAISCRNPAISIHKIDSIPSLISICGLCGTCVDMCFKMMLSPSLCMLWLMLSVKVDIIFIGFHGMTLDIFMTSW
jgi:hypothetical protein